MNDANLVEGEEADSDNSGDELLVERAPTAGVKAVSAVVSHNEIAMVIERNRFTGQIASIRGDIGLREHERSVFRVYSNDVPVNRQCFAGQTDNALDEIFLSVAGVFKNDYIAAVRRTKAVGYLVNDQEVAVVEIRLHACAGDQEGLGDKVAYKKGDCEGNQDDLENIPGLRQKAFDSAKHA